MKVLTLVNRAAIATCTLLLPPAATASTVPPCPRAQLAVELQVPSFARAHEDMAITVAAARSRVPSATVVIGYAGGRQPLEIPISFSQRAVPVAASAKGPEPELRISSHWLQDVGTPAECRGEVVYLLRVVPAKAEVGNPYLPRFFGRFKLKEIPIRPRGKIARPTWRLRPECDFFACATKVRSSLGLRGQFKLLDNGDYELEKTLAPFGGCTVEKRTLTGEFISKETIKRAFNPRQLIRVKVGKSERTNRVVSFSGTLRRILEPTRRAVRKGCDRDFSTLERVEARLIR